MDDAVDHGIVSDRLGEQGLTGIGIYHSDLLRKAAVHRCTADILDAPGDRNFLAGLDGCWLGGDLRDDQVRIGCKCGLNHQTCGVVLLGIQGREVFKDLIVRVGGHGNF